MGFLFMRILFFIFIIIASVGLQSCNSTVKSVYRDDFRSAAKTEIKNIQEEVEGRPEQMVISTMMLRSMQQAHYDDTNLGHFGLSAEYYTHFTSPIRRYPDLTLHRGIKYLLAKEKK